MKMQKRKPSPPITWRLKCISALPYNPNFAEEVTKLRQKYQIPGDSDKASRWFLRLLKKYEKSAYAMSFDKDEFPSLADRALENVLQTEIPIELDILMLLKRYCLPLGMYFMVTEHVLSGIEVWLYPFLPRPKSKCEFDFTRGEPELKATITGITFLTTKKEWDFIWDNRVKQYLKALRAQLLGVTEPANKRTTLLSLAGQIKRWSEWYQLVEIEGLPIGKALRRWEGSHPEQVPANGFDESTVSKAISEFRKIITPISIKD